MAVTIYHNPRCSKSRATLALLQERGADLKIVEELLAKQGIYYRLYQLQYKDQEKALAV